ncbi:hypothetical protein Riv7116_0961 [Rivularia sp. PCC 7116]|nr:hypothetical protein [Rivularia sp. PCC 7116]AFY53536.1 hypothetical protein Riv7116_0961 [Rivularia sp. PCC 7116]
MQPNTIASLISVSQKISRGIVESSDGAWALVQIQSAGKLLAY